ncbi:tryptophan synthase, alpha subunit [Desulfurispirillum indicum S5]|uniref:Tryptophan synthase alpha chain n=1 Tax=Desulfurispirillum indicum (strain ATCC BAA-1389 / DSM 22839 / S5) TaxID=653733 RepID=E6W5I7_DESIS|nr:tryptophan synthase subunit alpha [Desulfurispirillum indicum]ADU64918.1 tryptophan synthase, alpha subunit [Desulfurispirillum indicum S5]
MNIYSRIIPYITLGYPDLETTQAFLELCYELGIKRIEIGIPFSDPMADGPVIQEANDYALARGINFRSLEALRIDTGKADHYVMTYANLFYHYGPADTFQWLTRLGYRGAIIPDLSFEQRDDFAAEVPEDFALVPFIATTTDDGRVEAITSRSAGFIYAVSSPNVTGQAVDNFSLIEAKISLARQHTSTPIFIGFGIKDGQTAAKAMAIADGAIIGTALIQCIQPDAGRERNISALRQFLQGLQLAD